MARAYDSQLRRIGSEAGAALCALGLDADPDRPRDRDRPAAVGDVSLPDVAVGPTGCEELHR